MDSVPPADWKVLQNPYRQSSAQLERHSSTVTKGMCSSLIPWRTAGNCCKRQILCLRPVLNAPQFEETTVAQCNVVSGSDAEPRGNVIDPFGSSFKLRIIPDRRLVHHTMAFTIVP